MKPIEALSEIKKLLFGEEVVTPEVPVEAPVETPAETPAEVPVETPAEVPQDFSAQFASYDEKFVALEKEVAEAKKENAELKTALGNQAQAAQKIVLMLEEYFNAPSDEVTEAPTDGLRTHRAKTKAERIERLAKTLEESKTK